MLALAIIHRTHSEATWKVVRQFEDLTVAAGFSFRKVEIPRHGSQLLEAQPAIANHRTLILWCTRLSDSDRDIPQTVASFSGSHNNADVIVYAHEKHWSGKLAISCIRSGARDFMVEGIHNEIFEDQIQRLAATNHSGKGRSPYGRYKLKLIPRANPRKRVFIATPYSPESRHDRYDGISPALEALGVEAFESIDEYGTGHILTKIINQIDESDLVICNISRYRGEYNPNVALEIGYAMSRPIKPIIIQRMEDKDKTYADLRGVETLRYHHCSDLAVQLFLGLRDCIV